MVDISNPTTDISLFDKEGVNDAEVDNENRLWVNSKPATGQGHLTLFQSYAENGKAFSVIQPFITLAGQSETDFLLFRNPTGSTIRVKINDILYTYNKGSGISIVRVYNNPTITSNGIALTALKMNTLGSISPQALVNYAPTISARGTIRKIFGQSAIGTYVDHYDSSLILGANSSILFTVQPAANNTDHSIYVNWGEE